MKERERKGEGKRDNSRRVFKHIRIVFHGHLHA